MVKTKLFCVFPFLFALMSPLAARADTVSDLVNLLSKEWRDTAPIFSRMQRHSGSEPLRITVHFTDEPKNLQKSLREKLRTLLHYSLYTTEGAKKRLWGDVPYHFYISADGKLGEGRPLEYMADSNTAYQRDGHLTIVLEGNQADGISAGQKSKLFALIQALQEKFWIPTGRVGVHKNYAATDCPGEAITRAVKEYKKSRDGLK